MKKIFTTLAVLSAVAGSAFAQVSVGAGYLNSTSTTVVTKTNGDGSTSKSSGSSNSMGFYVGGNYTFDLGSGLSVNPGLYYSYLTSKDSDAAKLGTIFNGNMDVTLNEHYISIPVDLNYGYQLTDGFRIFAYAGPTFQYCVSSKTKVNGEAKIDIPILGINKTYKGGDVIDNINGDGATYKPFDVLVGGGIGCDIAKTIRVQGGYNYGLINRSSADNTTLHRAGWHVGVSYLF